MNKEISLVIMAAGMGSRFGGLKQIEPMGPAGEFIIDYSVYDAIKAGFTKIIFIIKKENYSKGVVVTTTDNQTIIGVYVVVSYGVKISEVAKNIQERIRFNLENQLGIVAAKVNVYVQNVKVVED